MSGMLEALVVKEKDGKSFWTKIGAAWPGRDGASFIVRLDALPMDGVIHLRPKLPKRDERSPVHREPGDDQGEEVPW
jgi:hypothetical protein